MTKVSNLPFNFQKFDWVSCRKVDGEWYFVRGWKHNELDRAMRFYEYNGGDIFCTANIKEA